MGLLSTSTEQFSGPRSWIKNRISLDYSLWWPLRVLSWKYLKHSPTTLRPARRRLQGFGPFEWFKVHAFRALITHSAYAWESGLVHGACLVMMMEGSMVFCTEGFVFPDGLYCHVDLIIHSFPTTNCQIISHKAPSESLIFTQHLPWNNALLDYFVDPKNIIIRPTRFSLNVLISTHSYTCQFSLFSVKEN